MRQLMDKTKFARDWLSGQHYTRVPCTRLQMICWQNGVSVFWLFALVPAVLIGTALLLLVNVTYLPSGWVSFVSVALPSVLCLIFCVNFVSDVLHSWRITAGWEGYSREYVENQE
jgi:hypothetical protein